MRYLSFIYFLCIIGEALPQYANIVHETLDEWDYIYTHDYRNEKIYSVGAIYDSNSTINGFTTIAFRVYDENFQKQIETRYTDSAHQYTGFYGLEYHKNHYYHCGTKGEYPNFDTLKGFVIKYDTLGNVIWEKNYYTSEERVKILCMASDDSLVYLLGTKYNPSSTGVMQTFLSAIDSTGTIIWDKDFIGLSEQAMSLRLTSDGGFLISLSSAVTGNVTNPIVYKLDAQRNIQWSKTLGPATKDHYLQFFEMPNGNYLGLGQSDDEMTGRQRAWLVELNPINGDVNKDTVYVVSPILTFFGVRANVLFKENEIIIIGGVIDDISTNVAKAFITSISYNYEINWLYRYHRRESDNAFFNVFEKNDFYFLQGIVASDTPSNTVDEWFLVVDSLGCDDSFCTVGIADAMYQYNNESNVTIYPNPAASDLYIKLEDSQDIITQVTILDAMGNVVQRSNLSQNLDVSMLSNGIYLLQITTKEKKYAKKFIIQR